MEIHRVARNANSQIRVFFGMLVSVHQQFTVHDVDVDMMRAVFKIAIQYRYKVIYTLRLGFPQRLRNDGECV